MKEYFVFLLLLFVVSCSHNDKIIDKSGFYYLIEEDSIISMKPRIQPHQDGYGINEAYIRGLVPNKEAAKMIAESVWLPIYGTEIYTELPYIVQEQGDSAWFVEGTLHKGLVGGTCQILIRKKDGMILYVGHEE